MKKMFSRVKNEAKYDGDASFSHLKKNFLGHFGLFHVGLRSF